MCRYLPKVLEELQGTGGRCEAPAISQAAFWGLLQLLVAKGALAEAQALLATHWLASSAPEDTLSAEHKGLQVRRQGLCTLTAAPGESCNAPQRAAMLAHTRCCASIVL